MVYDVLKCLLKNIPYKYPLSANNFTQINLRRDGAFLLNNMVNLILYGDIKDKSITSKLCRVLSGYGGVLYFSDSKAVKYGDISEVRFNIYECDNLREISIENSIFIFKSKQTSNRKIKLCDNIIVITEPHNHAAITAISENQNPCITCGMSSNDTVTISSISDNSVTISIQRSIKDLKNNVIDPCEFTLELKSFCDGYTLLSTICALIAYDSNILSQGTVI